MKRFRFLLLMSMIVLLLLPACDFINSEEPEKNLAPSLESLQEAIAAQGGWHADAFPTIRLVGDGGRCVCKERNAAGECTLYECGGSDNAWGPVLVPRPKALAEHLPRDH